MNSLNPLRALLAHPLRKTPLMFCLMIAAASADAQEIPRPLNRPYPGIIELQVDATNVGQRIFRVHERIPVKGGKLTLLYPQWRLGTHAPADAHLAQFAGLLLSSNHRRLEWTRDPLNMYAFHVDIPGDAATLEADFEFLSPVEANQGAILATPDMLAVHWESVVLYPAGYYAHGVTVRPSVTLPASWPFAAALEAAEQSGTDIRFKPVNLEELIDSPSTRASISNASTSTPGRKCLYSWTWWPTVPPISRPSRNR